MENSGMLGLYINFALAALGSLFAIMTILNAIKQVEEKENSTTPFPIGIMYMGLCATSVMYSFMLLILSSDKELNEDVFYWGVLVGLVLFFSPIVKGKICADGIKNRLEPAKTIIYAVFSEFVAIIAFLILFQNVILKNQV